MISVCTGVRVPGRCIVTTLHSSDHSSLQFSQQHTPVNTAAVSIIVITVTHIVIILKTCDSVSQYLSSHHCDLEQCWYWPQSLSSSPSLRKWFVSRTTFPHFPTSENRSCTGVDGSVWTVGAGIVVVSDQRRECSQFSHTSGQSSPGCF